MSIFTDAEAKEFLDDINEPIEDHVIDATENKEDITPEDITTEPEPEEEDVEDVEDELESDNIDEEEEEEEEESTKGSGEESDEDTVAKEIYNALFKDGVKANGKVKVIRDVNHAKSLIQQGLAYPTAMNRVKPLLRHAKSFEQAGVTLDDEKVSFMIDLLKGDKKAIASHLKNIGADLDDIAEHESEYVSNSDKNIVDNNTVELLTILEEVKQSEHNDELIGFMNNLPDDGHEFIHNNPEVVKYLLNDMDSGVFSIAMEEVAYRKETGKLPLTNSDLHNYIEVMKDKDFLANLSSVETTKKEENSIKEYKPKKIKSDDTIRKRKKQVKQSAVTNKSNTKKELTTDDIHELSISELEKLVGKILN